MARCICGCDRVGGGVPTPLAREGTEVKLNIRETFAASRAVLVGVYSFRSSFRVRSSYVGSSQCVDQKQQRELGGAVLVAGPAAEFWGWRDDHQCRLESHTDRQLDGDELSLQPDRGRHRGSFSGRFIQHADFELCGDAIAARTFRCALRREQFAVPDAVLRVAREELCAGGWFVRPAGFFRSRD